MPSDAERWQAYLTDRSHSAHSGISPTCSALVEEEV
jgi:hypothetical protein